MMVRGHSMLTALGSKEERFYILHVLVVTHIERSIAYLLGKSYKCMLTNNLKKAAFV